MIKSYLHTAIR